MRPMPWLILGLVIIACTKESTPAPPPDLPDLYTELRAYVPGDLAKPNPKPRSWMIGCFTFIAPADLKWSDAIPPDLELTDRPVGDTQIKSRYAVKLPGRQTQPSFWSWMPISEERIEVNVGTGFFGWSFDLHQAKTGLEGTGRWWSDTVEFGSPVAVTFKRTPCPQ